MIEFAQGLMTGVFMTVGFLIYLGHQAVKDHPEASKLIRDKLWETDKK